ncbi:MAG: indolepyruvate ferredoxin oxidoreductase subunit alpha [Betaproteobacteria bacterium]|nr:indolepyruvate ferredoxin oxidoreductase subunit alpha [Betaproteobacteria bacterium]MDH5220835.1 indolepyruvate ferredoxin oxidoreductase subunit alpha [Betaproteobacteria bacterium]MDH5349835.1 indolepyruvate ferredoxin oxidoreductase subunit alpha [Betaproteobacteria bacterium]
MERSFKEEVEKLKLGEGAVFHGEGILAVTKALLQSGVSYVGGYQGAPVSHMMDVLNDARDILDELGVHVETNASEAGAAAMLGASINYPLRGAVTFKSTVGTNVASDALSNLASAGVKGGALVVLGEDYGEGASIIQERSHAFAMKSQMWLLDPRPSLPKIVEMVEKGFELSEASSTPVLLELRIRACHVQGSFVTRANRAARYSRRSVLENPDFDFGRISLPPATYAQEKHKIEVRWPAAVRFIREHALNEVFPGERDDVGILCQGGMYNAVIRALQQLGLADPFGAARIPIYCMNVTYPLVPEEIVAFCAGKREVLVVEEGQPAYLEDAILATLRRHEVNGVKVLGKGVLPMAGEYTGEVMLAGVAKFLGAEARLAELVAPKQKAAALLGEPLPTRPPGFCVGCPERPVFAAMKLVEKDLGKYHVSADIGCHTFSTLPPFNIGHTVLGYGLGLASNSAVNPMFGRRSVTIMGDGGFWHNGLTSGVANAVFNKDDGILVIMKNGYSSATGTQELPSSPQHSAHKAPDMSIERALRGLGVGWMRTVHTYHVGEMKKTLTDAMTTDYHALKVIIADGECQLERQRKLRPQVAAALARGERTVRVKYGVDEDTCTGDHSCIRLSGCPTLTVKDNPDPLRRDPVATVIDGCVGCGLCGENAHAATLCPSFYRAEVIQNPTLLDRALHGLRGLFVPA